MTKWRKGDKVRLRKDYVELAEKYDILEDLHWVKMGDFKVGEEYEIWEWDASAGDI